MDITIEKIIDLCEDVDVTEAQIKDFALLKVAPGARYHVRYDENSEHFLAFTQNYRRMFASNQYLGCVLVGRVMQAYYIHFVYVYASAIVLTDSAAGCAMTPIGGYWAHTIMSNAEGGHLYNGFRNAYRVLLESDPVQFERDWKEIANKSFKMKL